MNNLITDHMDIWTAAQTQKSNGGRGRGSNGNGQSSHGIKKLRELILELAVRGKLVPQDSNDEPASLLLERIAKEKKRLIKEDRIKKEKPLPEIGGDEKTFELPEGWEWAKLGNVVEFVNGYAFKSSDFSDIGVGIVKIGDIQNGEVTTAAMSRVDSAVVMGLDDSLRVCKGEMLIAMSGATTGKLGFNKTNEVYYINQRVGKISPYHLYVRYLYYPLTNKIAENLAKSMGSAIPNLSTAQIKNIVFAIPPLAEQHRIVAKVDELMTLCDQLEQQQTDSNDTLQTLVSALLATLTKATDPKEFTQAWQRIADHFDTLFTTEQSIDQLKQTIFQLAVMGKLVPQDPNDEPAGVLLNDLKTKRGRPLKGKRVKFSKLLPEINPAEVPYNVPKGWEWVRFFTINAVKCELVSTKAYPLENQIGPDCIEKGSGRLIFHRTVKECHAIGPNNRFYKGQILYSKIRPSLNKAVIAPYEGLCSADMYPIDTFINPEFMLVVILSETFLEQVRQAENRVKMPKLNLDSLGQFILPLPPFSEQHRIVAKVDELMALCDELKARLNAAQSTQIQVADAIVEKAVA